jgi:hypothetical protein
VRDNQSDLTADEIKSMIHEAAVQGVLNGTPHRLTLHRHNSDLDAAFEQ